LKNTQDYDVTLKLLIAEAGSEVVDYLIGAKVKDWLNVELPQVRNPRIDLLARLESDELIHIELQSTNEMTPQRMLEYAVGIWRQEGSFPRQVLLYVGNEPLRIQSRIDTASLQYRFEVIDIRTLDGDKMLESESLAVSLLSVLAKNRDPLTALARIIMRLAGLMPERRKDIMQRFLILAGMRGLELQVREESNRMPITFDIMENKVLGPAILEGEKKMLRLCLEARFGSLPEWVDERLANCTYKEAEALGVRFVTAQSLDELFA